MSRWASGPEATVAAPGSVPRVPNPEGRTPEGRDPVAGFWALSAGLALALLPVAPDLVPLLPECGARMVTGWPCPGCGTGRAVLLVAAGDPWTALLRHPLPTLAGAAFVGGGFGSAVVLVSGGVLPRPDRWLGLLRRGLPLLVALGWIHAVATGV